MRRGRLLRRHRVGTVAATPWDPSMMSTALTGWWRADYAGSPWADDVASNDLTEATNAPATGAAVNGRTPADFDGTNDLLTAPGTLDTYMNAAAWSAVFLAYVDTAPTDPGDGARYTVAAILSDTAAYMALGVTDGGFYAEVADGIGASSTIKQACSTGAWHMLFVRYNGTNIELGVDQVALSSQAYASLGGVAGTVKIGRNWDGSAFYDGKLIEVLVADHAISNADRTSIRQYFNTRYGLAL